MPRLPDLPIAAMTPAQRLVHDRIVSGPRGKVEAPLRVWLQSPELADRAQALGAFCRYGTSLPPHLSELAILVTGAHWRAGFEWAVHAPIALAAGLPAPVIEAIRLQNRPVFSDPTTEVVYDFSREIIKTTRVSSNTYDAFVNILSQKAAVELVGVLGYYTLISMTITAFEIDLPDGATNPFEDG